jgi:hypothetical protein
MSGWNDDMTARRAGLGLFIGVKDLPFILWQFEQTQIAGASQGPASGPFKTNLHRTLQEVFVRVQIFTGQFAEGSQKWLSSGAKKRGVELIDDFFAEYPAPAGGLGKVDTTEADEVGSIARH